MKRLLEAIGQGGEFAVRNLGRPELQPHENKAQTSQPNFTRSMDPDAILIDGLKEYKVVRCLPPSCWWTPRRLPLGLRPRQPPPLRQTTQRNDQNAQSPRRTEPRQPKSRATKNLLRRRGGRRTTAGWPPRTRRPRSSCSGRRRPAAAPPSWPGAAEGRGAGTVRGMARRRAPLIRRAAAPDYGNFDIFRLRSCGFGARGLCISFHPGIVGSASLAPTPTGRNQDLRFQPHCRLSVCSADKSKHDPVSSCCLFLSSFFFF